MKGEANPEPGRASAMLELVLLWVPASSPCALVGRCEKNRTRFSQGEAFSFFGFLFSVLESGPRSPPSTPIQVPKPPQTRHTKT
jgi:hypothetical protein